MMKEHHFSNRILEQKKTLILMANQL